MTLAQQFPDTSLSTRKSNRLRLRQEGTFRVEQNNQADQKFYDRAFRIFHIKAILFIAVVLIALFFFVLNAQGMWRWIVS